MKSLPTVVLVGRANVGKSSLFNRLVGEQAASVSAIAGTTRDRKERTVEWNGHAFTLVDTGGVEGSGSAFNEAVATQTKEAIKRADLIAFVVDLKEELLPQDQQIIRLLRTQKKPLLVIGNKAETRLLRSGTFDDVWFRTGLPAPLAVSAVRGNGLGDLLDAIVAQLPSSKRATTPASEDADATTATPPRIAIVGVPNVGKSSIINAILNEERFITSPIAHTTREPNDANLVVQGKPYTLVDTAGISRATRAKTNMDAAMIQRSLTAIRQSDVAVLVLDATKQIDRQERVLADAIASAHIGAIIVLNKWDTVPGKTSQSTVEAEALVRASFPHLDFAPFLTVSAKERQRVFDIFPLVDTIREQCARRLTDRQLDRFLREVIARHKPSRGKGVAHPHIFRLKQLDTNPPTFELVIKGLRLDVLHPSYLRFLENRLRDHYGFLGTPIRFHAIPSKKL